jgi:DNA-directed RNA polymerase beta' subunit
VVLATLGPGSRNFQESLSTLQFAGRCKDIQLTPVSHASVVVDDEEVSALKELVEEVTRRGEEREAELQGVVLRRDQKIQMLEGEIEQMRDREREARGANEAQVRQVKM